MRLLYIHKSLASAGGIETSMLKKVPALRSVGIEAAVVAAQGGPMADTLRQVGAEVFLPEQGLSEITGSDLSSWQQLLITVINEYQPDIVHPQQLAALLTVLPLEHPAALVASFHSRLQPWISAEQRQALQAALPSVDLLYAFGQATANELRELGAREVRPLFSPIPDNPPTAKPRIDPDDPQLLFVGRPDVRKGLDVLIEALPLLSARYRQLRLVVIGNDGQTIREHGGGSDAPLANRLGVNELIDWRGRQKHSEVLAAISEADLLVSSSRSEGFPGVLLEAQAAGLPVVASPTSAETMNWGQSGLIVPADHPQLLAAAISAELSDGQRLQRAANNRRWVNEHYSQQVLVSALARDFSELLASGQPWARQQLAE